MVVLMLYSRLAGLLLLALLVIGFSQDVIQLTVLEARSIVGDIARVRGEVFIPLGRDSYKPLNYTHNIMITLEDASRNISSILGSGYSVGNITSIDTAIPLSDRRVAILRFEADWGLGKCYIYYALYNDYRDTFERIYRYGADPYFCLYPNVNGYYVWDYSLMVGKNYTVYLIKKGYGYYQYPMFRPSGTSENYVDRSLIDDVFVIAKLGDEKPEAKAIYMGRIEGHDNIWGVEDSNAIYTESRGGPSISMSIQPYYRIHDYLYYDMISQRVGNDLDRMSMRDGAVILNLDNLSDPEAIYFTVNTSGKGFLGKAIRTTGGGYLVAGIETNQLRGGYSKCDLVLIKYSGNLSIEWSKKYTINVSAIFKDLSERKSIPGDWVGNLTGDLRRDCENLATLSGGGEGLKPDLLRQQQWGAVSFIHEVVDDKGDPKGYIVGTGPYGNWRSPKDVYIYLYGMIYFMVDTKGEILWNVITFSGAGTQGHYIAPVGNNLAAVGHSWASCCGSGSWFYWVNISNGEIYYYYDPSRPNDNPQRPELAYVTWLNGRGLGSSLNGSSGVLFVRYAEGSPYYYIVGSGSSLEIGFATYDDILNIASRRAPPYNIWFVVSSFNATEYNYTVARYKPLILSVDGPTKLPGTEYTIIPSKNAGKLVDIRPPDNVEVRMDTLFRYPRILLPGQLRFEQEPKRPESWSPLINNLIDLGAVKTGDMITYRIEGIRMIPRSYNSALRDSDPMLFLNDPHIVNSVEGVKYSLGNYSTAGLKQRFVLEITLSPKIAGQRAFALVFRETYVYEKNPYPDRNINPRYTTVGSYRVEFIAKVTDYAPPKIDMSRINTSIKFPLTVVDVNTPMRTIPGVPDRYNIYITNIGTEEAVFIYAVFMPFYIRVKSVLGADSSYTISGAEDSDLVALFTVRIPPGAVKAVQVLAAIDAKYITELTPQGDGWRGWKIKISGRGFQSYKPLAVQVAALPPEIWSNLTKDLGRNPMALLDKAIDIGLNRLEDMLTNISKTPGASMELMKLREANVYGLVLADYIESQLFRRAVIDPALLDLTDENKTQPVAISDPMEIKRTLVPGLQKLERMAKEKLYGDIINATRTKGLENLPPSIASLIESAVIYNKLMVINKLIDPTYSYIPVEVWRGSPENQKTSGAGAAGNIGGLGAMSPKASLLYPIAIASQGSLIVSGSDASDDNIELQGTGSPQGSPIIALADPNYLFNCYKLANQFGLFDPKEALKLRVALEKKNVWSAALVDILDALNPKVLEWREKYRGMDLNQLLIHALVDNDKDALAYYDYLTKTAIPVSGVLGLGQAQTLPLLEAYADNSGLGMALQAFGIYGGGQQIDYTMPGINLSIQGHHTGTMVGTVISVGTLIGGLVSLGKAAYSAYRLQKAMALLKNIDESLIAYQDISINNPQLLEFSYNFVNGKVNPAIHATLLGDTQTGQMLTMQGIEEASKYFASQGIKGTEEIFSVNGKTYLAGQTSGFFSKPFIIESVEVSEELGGKPVLGAMVTLSKNPKTGAIYFASGHVPDKVIPIKDQSGNIVKYVHPADIHITPSNGYVFSMKSGSALINTGFERLTRDEVINMFQQDPAVVNYLNDLPQRIYYYEDAVRFYGMYSDLLNNGAYLNKVADILIKRGSISGGEGAVDRAAKYLRDAMQRGDYQTILDLGKAVGRTPDDIKIEKIDFNDLYNQIRNNADLHNLDRAFAKSKLEKSKGATEADIKKFTKELQVSLVSLGGTAAVALGSEPLPYKEGVKTLRGIYVNTNGKTLQDCLPFIKQDLPSDLQILLGTDIVGGARYQPNTPPSSSTLIVGSMDPNQVSVEPRGYITYGGQDLRVLAEFENYANASASAVNVSISLVIRGPVDADSVDVVDISHRNAFLSISKGFSKDSLILNVTFTEINLPPNKRPPEGQGWVVVAAKASKNISTGDSIEVYADIVFDYNPPLRTNREVLVVDLDPPTTVLKSVEAGDRSIRIQGICQDRGSGCDSTLAILSNSTTKEIVRSMILNASEAGVVEARISDLDPGEYEITLTSTDRAGNTETKVKADGSIKVEAVGTTTPKTETPTTTVRTTPQQSQTPIQTPITTARTTTTSTISETTVEKKQGGGYDNMLLPAMIGIALAVLAIAAIMIMRSRRSKS
ncbi:MAG: hypothetical protein QXQ57_04075 [Sulfolobales archaeon]